MPCSTQKNLYEKSMLFYINAIKKIRYDYYLEPQKVIYRIFILGICSTFLSEVKPALLFIQLLIFSLRNS